MSNVSGKGDVQWTGKRTPCAHHLCGRTDNSRITVDGDVFLILADGFTLTANQGISVTDGNSLTIYAQSEDALKMGALNATGATISAGIGAGIGGGDQGTGGKITISGGTVTASHTGDSHTDIRLTGI